MVSSFFVDQSFIIYFLIIIIIYFDDPEDDPSGKKGGPSSGVACLGRGLSSAPASFETDDTQHFPGPSHLSARSDGTLPAPLEAVRTFPRLDRARRGGGGEGGGPVR